MIKILRSACALVLVALVCIVAITPREASATDLKVQQIYLDQHMLFRQAILIEFLLVNQNILLAEFFTYRTRIWRKGITTPVYDQTESGENLLPFTERRIGMTALWNPVVSGEYEVEVAVNFSEDIDTSNNTLKQDLTLVEKPNIDLKVEQVVYFAPTKDSLTTYGVVSMAIPTTTTVKFLNVLVRRNSSSAPIWMVRNVMILPSDRTQDLPLHTWIDFGKLGYTQGQIVDSVVACVTITDAPLLEAPEPDVTCEFVNVAPSAYTVGPVIVDSLMTNGPQFFTRDELPAFFGTLPTVTDSVERGCTVPNEELDSATHSPTTEPGYAGDWNACGPVAAANSMQWLENSHPAIKTNLTLREKLKELSALMGRQAWDNGVTTQQMLRGKLAFIDKYKLPIRVKYQSIFDTSDIHSPAGSGHTAESQSAGVDRSAWSPKWEWYVQEMKDSEDVEIMVGWYDSTGRKGGHWFVTTGAHTIHGVHRFRFKDDKDQGTVGGLRSTVMTWDTLYGFGYAPEWSTATKKCYIESVLSESYDTTVKHEPVGGVDPERQRSLRLTASISSDRNVHVTFTPDAEARYWIRVVDLHGRTVTWLAENELLSIERIFNWNATSASAGVYFIVADGLNRTGMTKVIVE